MDKVKSLVNSLGSLNSRETEAASLVEWIWKEWEEIKKEANSFNRPKDAKRRTFGKKEGELVDKLVSICNYKCDSRNRETVNNLMMTIGYVGYDKKPRFRQRMENCLKKKRKMDKSFLPSSRKTGGKERKRSVRDDYSEEDQDVAADSGKNVLANSEMSSISLADAVMTPMFDDMDGYIMEDTVNDMKKRQFLSSDADYDEILQTISLIMGKPENYDSVPDQKVLTMSPSVNMDFLTQQTLSDTITDLSFQVSSPLKDQQPLPDDLFFTSYNPSSTVMNGWYLDSQND